MSATRETFIFPLNAVLFPDGVLPLRIFEQRYLEMTKTCLRDNVPFGVCLIKEGQEVGIPAVPERVGCLASITGWDMPQPGLFELSTRGGERFSVLDTRTAANGLISGTISLAEPEPAGQAVDADCLAVLTRIIERAGTQHFPAPLRLDDASWVSYRLAEILPVDAKVKQELLEAPHAGERQKRLRAMLVAQGLAR
jgi:Lon protease-like protein